MQVSSPPAPVHVQNGILMRLRRTALIAFAIPMCVCVCVCVCERERERDCVCVCVQFMSAHHTQVRVRVHLCEPHNSVLRQSTVWGSETRPRQVFKPTWQTFTSFSVWIPHLLSSLWCYTEPESAFTSQWLQQNLVHRGWLMCSDMFSVIYYVTQQAKTLLLHAEVRLTLWEENTATVHTIVCLALFIDMLEERQHTWA